MTEVEMENLAMRVRELEAWRQTLEKQGGLSSAGKQQSEPLKAYITPPENLEKENAEREQREKERAQRAAPADKEGRKKPGEPGSPQGEEGKPAPSTYSPPTATQTKK